VVGQEIITFICASNQAEALLLFVCSGGGGMYVYLATVEEVFEDPISDWSLFVVRFC
jgi:hypothetical protein